MTRPVEHAFTINDPRIEPCPTTGCWLWTRQVRPDGYARTTESGRTKAVYCHRAVWEKARGPIPAGMVLDHVCRVRSCVNPDHLRVVTPRTNAIENSSSASALHARKTNCPKCGGAFARLETQRRCLHCRRQYSLSPSTKARNAERMRRVRKRFAAEVGQ